MTLSVAVNGGDILEVTLTSLVTDGTVKRVVSKEEFHDSTIIIKVKKLENRLTRIGRILTRERFLFFLTL